MIDRISSAYPGANFSDAVVVDLGVCRQVFVSGHVGYDESGLVTATDFAEEVRLCLDHLQRTLASAGASMANVVRITTYLTDLAGYDTYVRARGIAFAGAPPASATVGVAGLLANARIEIDAVAIVARPDK